MFYDIIDKFGKVMPRHFSGRPRTLQETQEILSNINTNGKNRPYSMVVVKDHSEDWRFPLPTTSMNAERASVLVPAPRLGYQIKVNEDFTYSIVRVKTRQTSG